MRYKISFLLFLLGILFILTGFFINSPSKFTSVKSGSSSIISSLPTTPILSFGKKLNSTKTEVLVTRVLDGDTIETSSGEKIRYIGINAPEIGQPFSSQATKENKNLVLGKKVKIEFDVAAKDRYARTLAYILVGSTFVNLEMVKRGLAVSETIQPNVKYQKETLEAQKEARDRCLGLWKNLCSTSSDASKNCIKIVTINADAPGNDNQNKNGEWIKIGNVCSRSVSMDKWLLKDSSASNKYEFHNFTLAAYSTFMLYSGCGKDSQDKLYWACPERKYAVWNNFGDHAFLYNEKGELLADYGY